MARGLSCCTGAPPSHVSPLGVATGQEAAELLIAKQLCGIQAALDAGLALKVNTVLIPGVNDQHVVRLARRMGDMGVHLMNIMPLIPAGKMKGHRAPTCDELIQARLDCEASVPQFRRCEQCRADVVRFPSRAGSLRRAAQLYHYPAGQ